MSLTKTMKKIIRHKNEHCMSSNLATPPEKTCHQEKHKKRKLFEIGSCFFIVPEHLVQYVFTARHCTWSDSYLENKWFYETFLQSKQMLGQISSAFLDWIWVGMLHKSCNVQIQNDFQVSNLVNRYWLQTADKQVGLAMSCPGRISKYC